MEAKVESALRWALRAFLADVETMAQRDGTYMAAGSVSQAWSERMSRDALATKLPDDVAEYVADMQTLSATPDEAYDAVVTVFEAAGRYAWSSQITRDAVAFVLDPTAPDDYLTAAAPSRDSRRGQALRAAFDEALGVKPGGNWWAKARAEARTAVTGLDGIMSVAEMKLRGVTEKRWVARHDERTRNTHAAADGQRVPVDQPFTVGGALLDHPGDRSGPVGEVINCRCITVAADDGFYRQGEVEPLADQRISRTNPGESLFTGESKAPYLENCTRVVSAAELRVRGLDVVANGARMRLGEAVRAEDLARMWGGRFEQARNQTELRRLMLEAPEGARFFVANQWKYGFGGHVWNAEIVSVKGRKQIRYFDLQKVNNYGKPENYLRESIPTSLQAMRVDNLDPSRALSSQGWVTTKEGVKQDWSKYMDDQRLRMEELNRKYGKP